MEIGRQASVISAGALTLALSVGVPMLAAAPAHAAECGGSGLLSGVTNGVCNVVDGVTDVVDGVTGGAVAPVTDVLDTTVSGATTTVDSTVGGTVGGTGGTRTTPSASPSSTGIADGLTQAVQSTCLPLVAGPQCDAARDDSPAAKKSPEPTPTPSETTGGTLPTNPPRPPINRPQFMESGEHFITVDPAVDPDDAGITLLWPGQYVPGLTSQMKGAAIRPRTTYDGVGTALTAALLLSAVLAARVVSTRRARADQQESIPFEGMRLPGRGGGGRHRLA